MSNNIINYNEATPSLALTEVDISCKYSGSSHFCLFWLESLLFYDRKNSSRENPIFSFFDNSEDASSNWTSPKSTNATCKPLDCWNGLGT